MINIKDDRKAFNIDELKKELLLSQNASKLILFGNEVVPRKIPIKKLEISEKNENSFKSLIIDYPQKPSNIDHNEIDIKIPESELLQDTDIFHEIVLKNYDSKKCSSKTQKLFKLRKIRKRRDDFLLPEKDASKDF